MSLGFHNFHHSFPWDYSASELGSREVFNPATAFIDLFAKLGLAYELKKASPSLVERKLAVLGDRKVIDKEGKCSFYTNRVNMFTEWVGGTISFLSPFLIIRWFMMAFYGTSVS